MTMSVALHGQVQELTSLLLQKDAEIEDYRESGATLSLGEMLFGLHCVLQLSFFISTGPEGSTLGHYPA